MSSKVKKSYPVDPETGLEYELLPEEVDSSKLLRNKRIRRAREKGWSIKQLAASFGLTTRTINRVLKKKAE